MAALILGTELRYSLCKRPDGTDSRSGHDLVRAIYILIRLYQYLTYNPPYVDINLHIFKTYLFRIEA